MSQRDYRILMGAAGWHHPEWANDIFYPDDLPEDWHLSFYANEFPVALVSDSQWRDSAAIEQLVDEIKEQATPGFKCVFELNLSGEWMDNSTQNDIVVRVNSLSQIQEFLSGLLVIVDSAGLESKNICDEIVSLKNRFNVCLELKNDTKKLNLAHTITFCEQNSLSVCWTGEGEVIVPANSKFWVVRCDSNQENKELLKQFKTVIAEQLKHESQSREHVLIVDGTPPKIEAIRNANIMMDIM